MTCQGHPWVANGWSRRCVVHAYDLHCWSSHWFFMLLFSIWNWLSLNVQKFVVEFVYIQIIYIFLVFLYLMEQVLLDVLLDSLKKITTLMPLICKFVSFSFFFVSLLSLFMSHLRLASLLISFTFPSFFFSRNPYPRTCLWFFPFMFQSENSMRKLLAGEENS